MSIESHYNNFLLIRIVMLQSMGQKEAIKTNYITLWISDWTHEFWRDFKLPRLGSSRRLDGLQGLAQNKTNCVAWLTKSLCQKLFFGMPLRLFPDGSNPLSCIQSLREKPKLWPSPANLQMMHPASVRNQNCDHQLQIWFVQPALTSSQNSVARETLSCLFLLIMLPISRLKNVRPNLWNAIL